MSEKLVIVCFSPVYIQLEMTMEERKLVRIDGMQRAVQLSGAVVVKKDMHGPAGSGSVPLKYSPNGDCGVIPPVRKEVVLCAWRESIPSAHSPKDKVHVRCVESALATFPTSVRCCVDHHSNHQRAPVVPHCVSTVRRVAPCTEPILIRTRIPP